MLLRHSLSAAALAGGLFASGLAQANQNLYVIPGIGPEPASSVHAQGARAHLGHPSMNPAPVAQRRAPPQHVAVAGNAPGGYGAGFIELLVTGRDPTPRAAVMNVPPDVSQQRLRGHHSLPPAIQAAPRVAPQRHAAIAPDAGVPARGVHPRFERQEVDYAGRHSPGTIVVDTPNRYLYLVLGNGRAMRYGIGVGRPGFEWAGNKTVTRKAEWPDWRPPAEMLKRRPDLPTFMKGGPDNPLGARALYLGSSLYRIHGTNEPWTIGQNVSSGCIRMMNDDVVDLYTRVRVGTKVVVI